MPACMIKAYSNDLRERVVAAVEAGESCRAVAGRFHVPTREGAASASGWLARGALVAPPIWIRNLLSRS